MDISENTRVSNLIENFHLGAEFIRAEGKTDTLLTKPIVALRNFANAPKNLCVLLRETAPFFLREFNSFIAHLHEA